MLKEEESRTAFIRESKPYQKQPDPGPEAGDAHYKPFASDLKKIDFGRKYEFKVDSNPRVGQYETDTKLTKPASRTAKINKPTSTYKRP